MQIVGLTSGRDSTDSTSYVTASISPTNGRRVFVGVANKGPAVPTISGNGQTWAQIATVTQSSVQLTVFSAVMSGASAGVITISFGVARSDCSWSVIEIIEATPTIVQSATNQTGPAGAANLTVTLAAFASAGNVAVGFFGVDANGSGWGTAGSGFTMVHTEFASLESGIASEYKLAEDITVDINWGGGDVILVGIALEINATETTAENYIKSASLLSYPESYIKSDSDLHHRRDLYFKGASILTYPERYVKSNSFLEATKFFYIKGMGSGLQALRERYIKSDVELQAIVFPYIKGAVVFKTNQLYIKGATLFQTQAQVFIRGRVTFKVIATYLKGDVALMIQRPLEELGDTPTANNQSGLLSRNWQSLATVKKQIV